MHIWYDALVKLARLVPHAEKHTTTTKKASDVVSKQLNESHVTSH